MACIGISMLSVLSALVALATYQGTQNAHIGIGRTSVPALNNVHRLARDTFALLAGAPALLQTHDLAGLAREMAAIRLALSRLDQTFSEIRDLPLDEAGSSAMKRISRDLTSLRNDLERQHLLTETRITKQIRQDEQRDEAVLLIERLRRALRPLHIDASMSVDERLTVIQDDLEAGTSPRSDLADAIGDLTSRDMQVAEATTVMEFRLDELGGRIAGLDLLASPSALARARGELSLSIRALVRASQSLPADAGQKAILRTLRDLVALVQGPDNVFQGRADQITIAERVGRLSENNLALARDLDSAAGIVLQAVEARIAGDIAHVDELFAWGRWSLVAIALLAIVSAIYVTSRFVIRDVADRIDLLADDVRAVAQGDIDSPGRVRGGDEIGEMAAAVEVFRDNARELRRSNADLETFAYVASHDLKSPLRAIGNLARMLREELDEAITGDTARMFDLLQRRVARLDALLDDLLQYSRVGHVEDATRDMDVGERLREVFDNANGENAFQLDLAVDGLHIEGPPAPFEQTFRNLFDNAIKHHDGPTGTISVTAVNEGEHIAFTVADDGPGIVPENHHKVFELFKTLKSRDQVEGSGMGLAIIRKIIQNAGGEIRVDSDPDAGRGCRFHFTWPRVWNQAAEDDIATPTASTS